MAHTSGGREPNSFERQCLSGLNVPSDFLTRIAVHTPAPFERYTLTQMAKSGDHLTLAMTSSNVHIADSKKNFTPLSVTKAKE
jgi:hypothetical protein